MCNVKETVDMLNEEENKSYNIRLQVWNGAGR